MDAFLPNPAFRTYALCAAILALKMIFSAFYTGTQRQRQQSYANPEDARTFGADGATVSTDGAPAVAHALRIQRNDGENIPIFFAVALIYVLLGATPRGAAVYCWTYTLARIAHTIAYTWNVQPWRAICFIVGTLCLIGMSVQIILTTL